MSSSEWAILLIGIGIIVAVVAVALVVLALYVDAKRRGQERADQTPTIRIQDQVSSRNGLPPHSSGGTGIPSVEVEGRIKWGEPTSLPPSQNPVGGGRSTDSLKCPVCRRPALDGRPTYACVNSNCKTLYHQECWDEELEGTCAVCGQQVS